MLEEAPRSSVSLKLCTEAVVAVVERKRNWNWQPVADTGKIFPVDNCNHWGMGKRILAVEVVVVVDVSLLDLLQGELGWIESDLGLDLVRHF